MRKKFNIFSSSRLIHGYSTRIGGVSLTPFNSLNLGINTKDDPQNVKKNRTIFFKSLNIDQSRCVFPGQVHSDNIQIVSKAGIVNNCDALITYEKNLFLTIQTADCFPVFLFDPINEIIALVHSGWRGTAQNIVGKTIDKMKCNTNNLLAAIGPGIQQSCYQVNKKTADNFASKYLITDGKDHYKLNILAAIYDQIREKDVHAENIEADSDCTHCRSDLYYSYRRDGEDSGRMMGIIGMTDDI